jgi:ubiquitin-activating enzyme E1
MTGINGQKFTVEVKTPGSFTIGDTRSFGIYENGGIASEVKIPFEMKFHDLEKSLRYPYPPDSKEMPIASWEKFGVPEQLHITLNGVLDFYAQHKRLPATLNEKEAE